MFQYTSLAIFLFSSLALAVNGGYSFAAFLLLFGSVSLVWKRREFQLDRNDRLMLGALFCYFIVYTLNNVVNADSGREYDAPVKFLLAMPVVLLLLAYRSSVSAWWGGLAVGSIAGCALAIWQILTLGVPRPQAATTNPIQSGNASMVLGILCMAGIGWALMQRRKAFWTTLMLAGTIAGAAGSVLSASRGGWLALPVCVVISSVHYANIRGKRYLIGGVILLVTTVAAAYMIPKSPLRERTDLAVSEVREFSANGNVVTSTGQRIEMWRTALALVPEHPFMGWGKDGYMKKKQSMVQEGKLNPLVLGYTNAHNDYIDALVKHGVVGLFALLVLFFVPLALFTRQLSDRNHQVHPYALAGVLLCTSYTVFGLTTTSLTLNIGVMLLIFPMIFLWSYIRHHQRGTV
jgi:O-antigen ligase